MSRLESFRRRLTAQIDGLNWACEQILDETGDVLELGLGNGRTYDHLRERLPDRRIWVVDRYMRAFPDCVPPDENFLQGDAGEMLAGLAGTPHRMALAHYDFGIGDPAADATEAAALAPLISAVMRPGGLVVSQQVLDGLTRIEGPETIASGRYMFYRKDG